MTSKKPPTKSGPYMGLTAIQARARLTLKILDIRRDCPEVHTTGQYSNGKEGEEFCFTKYSDVMREVLPILEKHRVVFIPYSDANQQTQVWSDRGMFFSRTHYALIDCDTGYRMVVPGAGMGMNRWWSLDTAMTLALKHALLQTCMINWDNHVPMQAMVGEIIDGATAAEMVRAAMKDELANFAWFGRAPEQAPARSQKKGKPQS